MPLLSTALTVVAFGAFAAIGVVLAVIDLRTHRLPNRIVGLGAAIGVVVLGCAAVIGGRPDAFLRGILAGMALLAGFLALRLISPAGIGGGDVKLAGVMGFHLGWIGWSTVALGAIASFAIGGIVALAVLMTRRGGAQTAIAFGPWMIAGSWVAIALSLSSA